MHALIFGLLGSLTGFGIVRLRSSSFSRLVVLLAAALVGSIAIIELNSLMAASFFPELNGNLSLGVFVYLFGLWLSHQVGSRAAALSVDPRAMAKFQVGFGGARQESDPSPASGRRAMPFVRPRPKFRMMILWSGDTAAADLDPSAMRLNAGDRYSALAEASRIWDGFVAAPIPIGFIVWEGDVRVYSFERTV